MALVSVVCQEENRLPRFSAGDFSTTFLSSLLGCSRFWRCDGCIFGPEYVRFLSEGSQHDKQKRTLTERRRGEAKFHRDRDGNLVLRHDIRRYAITGRETQTRKAGSGLTSKNAGQQPSSVWTPATPH